MRIRADSILYSTWSVHPLFPDSEMSGSQGATFFKPSAPLMSNVRL